MPEKESRHDETARLRQLREDMARIVASCDAKKYKKLLMALGIDPESEIGKKRMAAFYRSCNIDEP